MGLGPSWVVPVTTENWVAVGVFAENSDDAITEAMLVGVVGMKASRTEDDGTDLTGESSTKLEDLGPTDGARGSGMGRVDSTTNEGFVAGVVGIAASRTEDVGTNLKEEISTKLKDLGSTDGARGSGMGRVDSTTKEGFVAGVVGIAASRTEDVGTYLTEEISTKLEDLGPTDGARGSGMGRVDSTTNEGFVAGVVGIAASRTEDVGTYLKEEISTKLKDLGSTDGARDSGMGRVDSTTKEGFVAGVVGIAASRTEDVGTYLTEEISTKLEDLGPTDGARGSGMGRVDGWMGVRERFWPACACRATSEIARPVGTGGPRAKVDSGTGPVTDRGRCGDLAIMPVGIGKSPVPKCCRGGLATRPLVVEDSTSTDKPSKKALKSFILGEGNRIGTGIASAF